MKTPVKPVNLRMKISIIQLLAKMARKTRKTKTRLVEEAIILHGRDLL